MSESAGLVSISRQALDSDIGSSRSSTPNQALEAQLREQLRSIYETPTARITDVDGDVALDDVSIGLGDAAEGNGVEDYEFRLFSGPRKGKAANSDGAIQRIAIRSPTPISGDPGFVIPRRPDSYYFTGPLNGVRAEQIAAAAISGEEIVKGLNLKWRGCELPWRVTIIKSGQSKAGLKLDRINDPSANSTKKRFGKKRRIAIRKKMQAVQEGKIAVRRSQAEKQAAEKVKRTKRNREKKVKRKQKEKMQKMRKTEDILDAG